MATQRLGNCLPTSSTTTKQHFLKFCRTWHFIQVGCFSERPICVQDNELIGFVSLNPRTVNETIKSLERNLSSHECERLYRSWTILLAVLHPKFTPENMYMTTKWLFLNFLLLKRSSYNLGQNP